MYVNRLAALPIRVLGTLEYTFACVGCTASASSEIFAAAKSHLQRANVGPQPATRTEDIADVIVLSRRPKHER
jgi:hypothetical protein